jgi:hypothetical protein
MTDSEDWGEEAGAATEGAPATEEEVSAPVAEAFENPPGAGTPAGSPFIPPGEAEGATIRLKVASGGFGLPGYGLEVTEEFAAFTPQQAALLTSAAQSQGVELIEEGGS